MNFDQLNRYVFVVIGVFGALLYVVMAYAGFSELVSRMPKRSTRKKRARGGDATRRLPGVKKST
jgi:hypothetical protein